MNPMKRGILLIAAASLVTGAAAPDSGHCDSKPFTLKKAAAAPAKPAPAPAAAPAPAPRPVASKAAPKAKAKYQIGCKQPKN